MKVTKAIQKAIDKAEREGRVLQHRPDAAATLFGKRVVLPMPPTSNHLFPTGKHGRRYKSKEYQEWQDVAVRLLQEQMPSPPSFPVEVRIVIYRGSGWRDTADVCNREKAITDALVKAGVIPNDSCQYVAGARIGFLDRERASPADVAVWLEPATHWWEE